MILCMRWCWLHMQVILTAGGRGSRRSGSDHRCAKDGSHRCFVSLTIFLRVCLVCVHLHSFVDWISALHFPPRFTAIILAVRSRGFLCLCRWALGYAGVWIPEDVCVRARGCLLAYILLMVNCHVGARWEQDPSMCRSSGGEGMVVSADKGEVCTIITVFFFADWFPAQDVYVMLHNDMPRKHHQRYRVCV